MRFLESVCAVGLVVWAGPCHAGDGLPLSREEALGLALERNLGIRVARAEVEIAQEGVGREAGVFDPDLSVEYGVSGIENADTENVRVGVGGKLPTGASYDLSVASRGDLDQSNVFGGFAGLSFRQPLLRGFGLASNLADLKIARYQFDLSEWEYKQTLLDTLTATLFAYNDLYEAQQTLEIAVRSRELARQLVDDNRKRVELGVIAKLDIASAEAQLAFRGERVLQSSIQEMRAQNRLKQLIFDDAAEALAHDLEIRRYIESKIDGDFREELDGILENSPRYHVAEIALEIARLRLIRDRDQKLPSLDFIAQYGFGGDGTSLGGGLDRAFSEAEESYSLGFAARYPILNRVGRSRAAIAKLRESVSRIDLRRIKQAVQLEFRTAYDVMQTNWLRVEATRTARELAKRSLVAEEKKLNAGTSSSFVVLRLQNDLANAELRELAALANYNRSVAEFNRLRGVLE